MRKHQFRTLDFFFLRDELMRRNDKQEDKSGNTRRVKSIADINSNKIYR